MVSRLIASLSGMLSTEPTEPEPLTEENSTAGKDESLDGYASKVDNSLHPTKSNASLSNNKSLTSVMKPSRTPPTPNKLKSKASISNLKPPYTATQTDVKNDDPTSEVELFHDAESLDKAIVQQLQLSNTPAYSVSVAKLQKGVSDLSSTFGLYKMINTHTNKNEAYHQQLDAATSSTSVVERIPVESMQSKLEQAQGEVFDLRKRLQFIEREKEDLTVSHYEQIAKLNKKIQEYTSKYDHQLRDAAEEIEALRQKYVKEVKDFKQKVSSQEAQYTTILNHMKSQADVAKDDPTSEVEFFHDAESLDKAIVQQLQFKLSNTPAYSVSVANLQKGVSDLSSTFGLYKMIKTLTNQNEALHHQLDAATSSTSVIDKKTVESMQLKLDKAQAEVSDLRKWLQFTEREKEDLIVSHNEQIAKLNREMQESATNYDHQLQYAAEEIEALRRKYVKEVKDFKQKVSSQEAQYTTILNHMKAQYGGQVEELSKVVSKLQFELTLSGSNSFSAKTPSSHRL